MENFNMRSKFILLSIILLLLVFWIFNEYRKKSLIPVPEETNPYTSICGKIKKGKSLYSILLENNIDVTEAYKITNSLNKIFDLRYTHPNDSFVIQIDTLEQVQIVEYSPDKFSKYIVIRDTLGGYITHKEEIELIKEIKISSATIESSLYEAFVNKGINPEIVMDYSDIFQWDIDFFIDPREGDSCKAIYEVFTNNNEILKYGNILAASYKSKSFDLTAYYYDNGGKFHGYYDKNGKSFQKAFLKSPLKYSYISSYFGMRLHPITKKVWLHNGVDYAAPMGTPVAASADGVVIHKGWKGGHPTPKGNIGGYGNTIMIRHSNGYKTLYGHLSRYARGINIGTRVKQHDIIGYVGSTGWSTGPHLHYTIYQYDQSINPLKLKNVSGPPIPAELIDDFHSIIISLNELLNNKASNLEIVSDK
ncbi:MAG: M23 family metallopeptidase [Candidatus Cloacimonetes bacterium]|nr:M23 family metallopeptidase [Candidatus Cloacimonadota bacterium]